MTRLEVPTTTKTDLTKSGAYQYRALETPDPEKAFAGWQPHQGPARLVRTVKHSLTTSETLITYKYDEFAH